jgi:3-oxoacyl-[acyl-carrier-protein] synthase-3
MTTWDNRRNGHRRSLRYAHIIGWGMNMPARIMPNDDFKDLVKVGDDWIYPRTGIHERRVAAPGETSTQLAIRAAQQALEVAGALPREVDFVIVATSTPEYIFPSTASLVQDAIGAVHAGASDLAAACSGFVYALDLAVNKIRTGSINTALVIGAETMTRVLDWSDRKTCVLFGDGAGALVLRGSDDPGGVLHSMLHADGTGWDLLTLPTVGSQDTYLKDGEHTMHRLYMDGRCVFQFATRALSDGLTEASGAAGLTPHDLDLIVPHQANQRIIDTAAEELGLPREKFYSNLERYGNTSAASIPIALTEAANSGRLQPGDLVGLVGFGGGLSWGAAVIEWGTPRPGLLRAAQWPRRQQQVVQASVRRFWLRHYWRWMVYHSPKATLRRWRRKMRAASSGA